MSVSPSLPKYESWCKQKCPLCGQENIVVINGITVIDTNKIKAIPDRGYSFCNCRDIFYTNWSNIDTEIYYTDKYVEAHKEVHFNQLKEVFKNFVKDLKEFGNGGSKLLDLGTVQPEILIFMQFYGYTPTGLDITKRKTDKSFIVADFDYLKTEEKFDVIWATHFFEHLRFPVDGLKRCYDMLNPGGLLFLSMPDPFQIDWNEAHAWGHWLLRTHHIMWDRDSFCNEAEEKGFVTLFKKRNFDVNPMKDYHLLFKKC